LSILDFAPEPNCAALRLLMAAEKGVIPAASDSPTILCLIEYQVRNQARSLSLHSPVSDVLVIVLQRLCFCS
jgi:hypothetical protein